MFSIASDWYQPIFSIVIDISFSITTDFFIHIMQLTSKVQTPISFLFGNEKNMCGYAFS